MEQPLTVASTEQDFDLLVGLLDRLPVAMLLVDAKGAIARGNGQAAALLGAGPESLAGRAIDSFVPPAARVGHAALRQGYAAHPIARPMGAGRDLAARRDDGTEVPVEIALNPLATSRGPMVLAVLVDLTERREREDALRRALGEKDALLSEIHHRVKNNLQVVHSLLDMQSMRTGDDATRAVIEDAKHRVLSMSLIHQTLYQSRDFSRVDFRRFLEALGARLIEAYDLSGLVHLQLGEVAMGLPLTQAIPCGLLVNELVSNALKHGYPGRRGGAIRLALAQDADGLARLEVANDGVPLAGDTSGEGKLGLVLVETLVDQLHGRMTTESGPAGVRVTIRFRAEP